MSITVTPSNDLELVVSAIGPDGCVYHDTVTVSVVGAGGEASMYVPNVFTPNGEGLNETFHAVMADPEGFIELLIFNRWGQEIFRSTTISDAWGGRHNGKAVHDGTYMYIVRWRDRCDVMRKEKQGHATLLR